MAGLAALLYDTVIRCATITNGSASAFTAVAGADGIGGSQGPASNDDNADPAAGYITPYLRSLVVRPDGLAAYFLDYVYDGSSSYSRVRKTSL